MSNAYWINKKLRFLAKILLLGIKLTFSAFWHDAVSADEATIGGGMDVSTTTILWGPGTTIGSGGGDPIATYPMGTGHTGI